MKDELIKFETAKLAKEKGFNIPTNTAYLGNDLFMNRKSITSDEEYIVEADEFDEDWNKKGWGF